MNTNFVGKNGFIWWVGIVENRVDPLMVGRCQVRIFGWHNENTTILPTKDLPWAQAMIPLNNSKQFSTPSVGEWVLGFYMDGEQAQMPIMMGVLPGIKA
jgi:hypothetical protein